MTKKSASTMIGTTNHSLSEMVGKKIKSISMKEIDANGDDCDVCQYYLFTFTDGEKMVMACDGGGRGNQYATVSLIEVDEFEELLEEASTLNSEEDDESFLDQDDDLEEDDDFLDDNEEN